MSSDRTNTQSHLWDIRWVRDLMIIAAGLFVFWIVYAARSITVPIVIGFGIAYIFNPLIRWAQKRQGISRVWSAGALVAGAAAAIGAILMVIPYLLTQAGNLLQKLPGYAVAGLDLIKPYAGDFINIDAEQLTEQLKQADMSTVAAALLKTLNIGLGAIGNVVGTATYFAIAAVIIAVCFFFFSLKFDAIVAWFLPLIPASKRDRTREIIARMDRTMAAFIRGRLIQSLVMATVLSVGWMFAGVPYWLLLGVACGFLNLIPYAAVFGCAAAVALSVVNHLSPGNGEAVAQAASALHHLMPEPGGETANAFNWSIVIWPVVVYAAAQVLDGWGVEPLVQGQATNLDPLTVLLVVMIGATLFGLLGMLLAIPVAACVKILAKEVVLPTWREYADSR